MLLYVYKGAVNIDRMISCDFIATYGAYFELDDINLNGDNEYSFGALSVRRKVTFRSIKYLVTQGLVDAIDSNQGFTYQITPSGSDIVKKLKSDYAARYQRTMQRLIERFGTLTDKELRDLIDVRSRKVQK